MRSIWVKTGLFTAIGMVALQFSPFALFTFNKVDFNTEVKPILNKKCIACHGGVKKAGGFSVLFREEALGKTESGQPAIIPGHPGKSEFIKRLTAQDSEERMPYREEPLTDEEIDVLKRWVEQGAEWGDHWAYVPPQQIEVPGKKLLAGLSADQAWEKNDIDYFITDKLEAEGLKPSPEADKATLLRRVSLDLTGLPPSESLRKGFMADQSENAYEKIVDSLLSSPAYGERWAAMWLDLARYADSKGYEKDNRRPHVWHYRDWVIKAFNQDVPFDRFTTEQLAGDLLPNPTEEQYYATIFHRNTSTNDEGGTDDEEFRTSAVLDRVNTTWEIWQGTTFACVQCHSHPYDPFRHEDYYKSVAFFNNTMDSDLRNEAPNLLSYRPEETKQVEELKSWIRSNVSTQEEQKLAQFLRFTEPKYYYHDFEPVRNSVHSSVVDYLVMNPEGVSRLKGVSMDGKRELLMNYFTLKTGVTMEIRDGSENGQLLASFKVDTTGWYRPRVVRLELPLMKGKHDIYFKLKNATPRDPVKFGDALSPTNNDVNMEWACFFEGLPGKGKPGYEARQKQFPALLAAPTDKIPVTLERPEGYRRQSYVFERGNWLVKGKEVQPGVPAILNAFPKNAPRNRLGLARWLVSKDNPLTARTMVNRLWEQLFGSGLVETQEDFGTQGAAPTHPELLDYLALKFRDEYGWSMKKILKYLVLSAAYRQDSRTTPELTEKDPANRLLARGPHIRLTAEQVRDQALMLSGLLSRKMYGPGVMPAQPPKVWQVPFDSDRWETSTGEDRYRRAVYTFHKRSSPYPSLLTFDGSNRGVCLSRRIRTNTPLQALVTLNDTVYVEAALHFAKRMEKGGQSPESRIRYGYQLAMGKAIQPEKLRALLNLYQTALQEYRVKPAEAAKFLGEKGKPAETLVPSAALATVASTMLNLDELLTKE